MSVISLQKESEKQVNLGKFPRTEYCFIYHFNRDFYRVKLMSGSLGPL